MMARRVATNAKLLCYGGVGLTSSKQVRHLELASGKAISLAKIVARGIPLRPGCLGAELTSKLPHLIDRAAKLVNQVPAVLAECRERGE
jgi:hypothetical protein